MRANYRDQLDTISTELVEMTRLVGSAMSVATQSLLDADLNLAEQVIKDDQDIDALNFELEE